MFFDLLSTGLSTLEAQKQFYGKQPQAELKKGCAYKKNRVFLSDKNVCAASNIL